MEFIAQYGLFLAKTVTFVVAILLIISAIGALVIKQSHESKDKIKVKNLNKRFQDMADKLSSAILDKDALKRHHKAQKKILKAKHKSTDDNSETKRIFVIDFDGDIKASPVGSMREEISAILTTARESDEVVLRLESGGGMVHGYGLAASQLQRVKDKNIPLTICVDKIAASGGYMMACVAQQILSAPFAIIGSIGVLAQLPNFNKLLKDKHIEFEEFTGGDHKRTVTMFGKNTDEDRQKMQDEIEQTHKLFKRFVKQQRPTLEIDKVSNGDHWFGIDALELGLVDKIQTSDDYLMSQVETADIFEITFEVKKLLKDRLPFLASLNQLGAKNAANETHLHLR